MGTTCRCESEELESVGVKVEESTQNIPNNSNWSADRSNQTPQGNRPTGTLSLSAVTNPGADSFPFYSSPGNVERWAEPYEASHSPRNETRSQIPWSPAQLHHSHVGSGRRSGDFDHPDSWPPSPSESGNWPAESYGIPATASELFTDQTRSRFSNQYHNAGVIPQVRAADYGRGQTVVGHDPGSQRSAWTLSEGKGVDRGSRSSRVAFAPAALSQHFTSGGSYTAQSFASAWSSSSPSPLESPSSPAFSPRAHVNYDGSYNLFSKADEEFITVGDYGEF